MPIWLATGARAAAALVGRFALADVGARPARRSTRRSSSTTRSREAAPGDVGLLHRRRAGVRSRRQVPLLPVEPLVRSGLQRLRQQLVVSERDGASSLWRCVRTSRRRSRPNDEEGKKDETEDKDDTKDGGRKDDGTPDDESKKPAATARRQDARRPTRRTTRRTRRSRSTSRRRVRGARRGPAAEAGQLRPPAGDRREAAVSPCAADRIGR